MPYSLCLSATLSFRRSTCCKEQFRKTDRCGRHYNLLFFCFARARSRVSRDAPTDRKNYDLFVFPSERARHAVPLQTGTSGGVGAGFKPAPPCSVLRTLNYHLLLFL